MFVADVAHEGFCLPILEAMATGGAVVCTDADGNRDFCADGENCLIARARPPRGDRRHRAGWCATRRCARGSAAPASQTAADYSRPKRDRRAGALSRRGRPPPVGSRPRRMSFPSGAAPRPADRIRNQEGSGPGGLRLPLRRSDATGATSRPGASTHERALQRFRAASGCCSVAVSPRPVGATPAAAATSRFREAPDRYAAEHAGRSGRRPHPAAAHRRRPRQLQPTPTPRTTPYFAASDQPSAASPGSMSAPVMGGYRANIYRLETTPVHVVAGDAARCAQQVRAAGARLYLTLRYDGGNSPATLATEISHDARVRRRRYACVRDRQRGVRGDRRDQQGVRRPPPSI